jgi:TraB/PrgY/gumN family
MYATSPSLLKKDVNDEDESAEDCCHRRRLESKPLSPSSSSSSHVSCSRRGWFQQVGGGAMVAVTASAASAATAVFSAPIPALAAEESTTLTTVTTSTSPPTSATTATPPQRVVASPSVCDTSVSVWQNPEGRIVYLLGTAHVSKISAALAGQLVRDTTPDGVFVELDPKRLKPGVGILASKVSTSTSSSDSGAESDDIKQPKKQSRVIVPQIQLVSSSSSAVAIGNTGGGEMTYTPPTATMTTPDTSPANSPRSNGGGGGNPIMKAASTAVGNGIKGMYKQLDSAGFESGEEFVVAINEAKKLGSDIVLGDRDVEVTLRRLTEGLAKTDIKALLNPDSELEKSLQALVPSKMVTKNTLPGANSVDDDEQFREDFSSFVETMKSKENVRMIMSQLKRLAPFLYEALVSERDAYMAAGLNGLNELTTIVAVVGIAHVDGIEANLSMNGWKQASPSCGRFQ